MQLNERLAAYFEWFHMHPELSYEEYETTARIKEILVEEGIEILPYDLETGLVAGVRGRDRDRCRRFGVISMGFRFGRKQVCPMHLCVRERCTHAGMIFILRRESDVQFC